jgi:hypothetical protein
MTTDARALAVDAYNKAQDLLYSDRSPEEDYELLTLAFVSKHYWKQAGGNLQFAIADWLISRVFAELGSGELAVEFSAMSLSYDQKNFPQWAIASMHEGAARAFNCVGMEQECVAHIVLAQAALELESNEEDASVIREQIQSFARDRV